MTTLQLEPAQSVLSVGQWWDTRVITAAGDLASLEGPWRTLGELAQGTGLPESPPATPIEQYDWVTTCAAMGESRHRLRVVALARGERLVGVMPLASQRVYGVRRLVMLGVRQLHEPMGLLASDSRALQQLAGSLAAQRRPVLLERLVTDANGLAMLRRELSKVGLVVVRERPGYPWIPLDASWTEPDVHLNPGRRSDLRRARRKAEKLGEVTTEIRSPRPDELDALLDEAFAVEARSWKGREGTALAADAKRADFYRRFAHAACRQGHLRMCFLRIGGQAVATQIAVLQSGGFWLLKIGYDAEFSACSPGVLLLREAIAYAARAGCRSFEFLGQTEPWIAVWTDRQRPCVALRAYPYNLHGAAAFVADAAVRSCQIAAAASRGAVIGVRRAAKACVMPLVSAAARRYVAGDTLEEALRVKERLAAEGLWATLGYWNADGDPARVVADRYLAALSALAHDPPESYVSIKLPALRFSKELLREVAEKAAAHLQLGEDGRHAHRSTLEVGHSMLDNVQRPTRQPCGTRSVPTTSGRRLHFDSLAPETAERTQQMIDELLADVPGLDVGCTLPGRWRRSVEDAHWAARSDLFVRVVKGQWADPDDPDRDPQAGYLEVINQLAGRARRVAVATHDVALAAEALRRLRAARTPCELELLHGLPMRPSIQQARELGVGVRVYVPYGETYLPYALSQVRRRPRVLWWLVKDALASLLARRPEDARG